MLRIKQNAAEGTGGWLEQEKKLARSRRELKPSCGRLKLPVGTSAVNRFITQRFQKAHHYQACDQRD